MSSDLVLTLDELINAAFKTISRLGAIDFGGRNDEINKTMKLMKENFPVIDQKYLVELKNLFKEFAAKNNKRSNFTLISEYSNKIERQITNMVDIETSICLEQINSASSDNKQSAQSSSSKDNQPVKSSSSKDKQSTSTNKLIETLIKNSIIPNFEKMFKYKFEKICDNLGTDELKEEFIKLATRLGTYNDIKSVPVDDLLEVFLMVDYDTENFQKIFGFEVVFEYHNLANDIQKRNFITVVKKINKCNDINQVSQKCKNFISALKMN